MPPKKVQNTSKAKAKPAKDEESSSEAEVVKKTTTKKPAKDKSNDELVKKPTETKQSKKSKKEEVESDSESEEKPKRKGKAKAKISSEEEPKKAEAKAKRKKADDDSEPEKIAIKDEKAKESKKDDKAKAKPKRGKTQDEKFAQEEEKVEKKIEGKADKESGTGEIDPECPLKNVEVYKESKRYFSKEFIEPHPTDSKQDKFWKFQLLKNPKTDDKEYLMTHCRFGRIGEVGEWIVRGMFNEKRGLTIYNEEIDKEKKVVQEATEAKTKGDTSKLSTLAAPGATLLGPRSPNPSQIIDPSKIDCPPDKYSPVADEVEVLIKDGVIYDKKMNCSNIGTNSNHFYNFQIQRDTTDSSRHYVFYRYGRNGLRGEWVLRGPFSEEKAIHEYRFKEDEQEKRGKYTALDINYIKNEADSFEKVLEYAVEKSSLPKSVAKLVQLIFDLKMIDEQMNQAGFDVKKAPLRKLTAATIDKAFQVLNKLSQEIKKKSSEEVIKEVSSEFYTLIPHNVGWKNMKTMMIDDETKIKEKLELLESLRQIQIAYNIVNNIVLKPEDNPIDVNYRKLNCKIEPVERSSDAFKSISKFLDNTKENHKLEIEDMFTINREGETERFMGHLENHLFLWHGSRLTNFVGILSQGLRIAPPEAPVSGYRLGKGIYLADMISKSVPYCYANQSKNTLCIMICEAACGTFNEKLYDDFNASQLPTGKHSTKALGRTAPPLDTYETVEPGVQIPMGVPKKSEHTGSAFAHNEFVVYDIKQVRIRYLLRVKVH